MACAEKVHKDGLVMDLPARIPYSVHCPGQISIKILSVHIILAVRITCKMPIEFEYEESAEKFKTSASRIEFEADVTTNPTWKNPDTGETFTWDHCLVL
jgi:hypothetical protein